MNYNIGMIGHRPEYIFDKNLLLSKIRNIVDILKYQYLEDLIINIGGDLGTDHIVNEMALEYNVKYHLFLPYNIYDMSEYWYDEQKNNLKKYFNNAYATTICSPTVGNIYIYIRYKLLIDNSNFVICFWNGKKQGITFDSICYALKNNKLVLNGLNDLKLITKNDILVDSHDKL